MEKKLKKGKKVTVLGAGNVGASIAFALAIKGLCSELLLIDINKPKAKGEAMDIMQGNAFCPSCDIHDGDYPDAVDSDMVIITVGIARKPGQTRIDLCKTNAKIMASVMPEIVKYAPHACYLVVSNPVDVLTYEAIRVSGLDPKQVIGSGTVLDSSRLRTCLADHAGLNIKNIHAYVFGEHGDSSFVAWSAANIAGVPLKEYGDAMVDTKVLPITPYSREDVEDYVKKSGGKIIAGKGATFYGIAASVAHIVNSLYSGVDSVLALSSMMQGEYGISDVCLSVPCVLGKRGIITTLTPKLSEDEMEKLHFSADTLKGVIEKIQI